MMMVQPGAAAHHEQHNSLTNQCLEAYYITHRSTYEYIAMHVLSRGRDDPHKTINPPTGRVLHRVHHVKYGSFKRKAAGSGKRGKRCWALDGYLATLDGSQWQSLLDCPNAAVMRTEPSRSIIGVVVEAVMKSISRFRHTDRHHRTIPLADGRRLLS